MANICVNVCLHREQFVVWNNKNTTAEEDLR